MMLERVNYLISAEVQLPEDEMADRIADIMYAAFGLNIHDRDEAASRREGCTDGYSTRVVREESLACDFSMRQLPGTT